MAAVGHDWTLALSLQTGRWPNLLLGKHYSIIRVTRTTHGAIAIAPLGGLGATICSGLDA